MDIPSALSGILAAKDLLGAIVDTRDAAKLADMRRSADQALSEALERTISIERHVSTLAARVDELEKENVRLREWSAERPNYAFEQIGEGVFAYVRVNSDGPTQGKQKLCCNCFDRTVKGTLQQRSGAASSGGWHIFLTCPNGCPDLVFTHYLDSV